MPPPQPEESGGSAGHVLHLIRRSGGMTRAEIIERTGLSRSTVGTRLDALQAAGLIVLGSPTSSARGRPPTQFHLCHDRGVLLVAEAGATGVRLGLTDLAGTIREERRTTLSVTVGPENWLATVGGLFDELLEAAGADASAVKGIGLAVPGPVDFERGVVVSPPIMTGWDGYPIRSWFAGRFNAPVLVDNDANAMAIGEHRASYASRSSMLMLKLATGIGAGIITGGQIYRGEDGAAGDIGHVQISPPDGGEAPACRCGNLGCIEAYAGGWALIRDLTASGRDVSTVAGVIGLIGSGDPLASRLARRAGRYVGIALSDAVSLLNPGVVVVGGELAGAADGLFAGIRESVYARSLPLATRRLEIVPARLGEHAGLAGLTHTVADHIFDAGRVDQALG